MGGLGRRWAAAFAAVMVMALALALVPGGMLTSAQDRSETDATVRFVHASPGAPDVDVIVDGETVAEAVSYGMASEYAPVSPGEHQVQIVPAGEGSEAAVIDDTMSFDGGGAYIVAVVGNLADIEARTYEVNLDSVEPGKARVRVIHAAPDAENLDVAVSGGDVLFGDLGFDNVSDYSDVDTGTYDFDVREAGGDRTVAQATGLAFEDGVVYDIFALATEGGAGLTLLALETNVSRPCSSVVGQGTETDACFRVVHASPGAPAVDVYVADTMVIEGLAYGQAAEFVSIPNGDERNIVVVPTGTEVGDDAKSADQDMTAGQAYQMVITGTVDDLNLLLTEVDLTPLPEDQARVRVVHAAVDGPNVTVNVADGPTLFEDVEFGASSDYEVVDAGTYDVIVQEAGDDTNVLLRADLDLQAGMVYDLIALNDESGEGITILSLEVDASVRSGGVATPETTSETPAAGATVVTPDVVGTPSA